MRSILLVSIAVLGVAGTAGALWADGGPPFGRHPRPVYGIEPVPQMAAVPPPNVSRIVIEVKADANKSTLILPRPMLDHVQAREETRQEPIGGPRLDPLLLAVALVIGGLCLLRGRVRLVFAAAMLLMAGVTLGFNRSELEASPPPPPPQPVVKRIKLGEVLLDDVEIVVKPDHDQITLTIPPSVLPRLRSTSH